MKKLTSRTGRSTTQYLVACILMTRMDYGTAFDERNASRFVVTL